MRNLNNILLLGSSGFFGKNIKNHLNQMNAKIFEVSGKEEMDIEVSDVPGDQGGRVYIYFARSLIDVDAHPSSLNLYSIKRLDDGNWVNIGSFGAQGNVQYIFEATTLLDSTHQNSGLTGFKILGQSFGASGYMFESEIEYGYSIDNIAPGVPDGLDVILENSQAVISWLPSLDEDFQYYSLEKDADETFQSF